MSSKRLSGLGRYGAKASQAAVGIEAAEAEQVKFELLSLDSIVPSPFQARRDFTQLDDLIEDVRANGILQPLLVRPLATGSYELVAGERRLRAARAAGLRAVPVTVRRMDDRQARIFGLTENLRREDLNAYEVAAAAVQLAAELSELDEDVVRAEIGHGRAPSPAVGQAMTEALDVMDKSISLTSFRRHYAPLLGLPAPLIEAIRQGASYVAVAALGKATPEQQREWLPKLVSGEWSYRQLQAALREDAAVQQPRPPRQDRGGSDLRREWGRVREQVSMARLKALDSKKQRRAQRLLKELADLVEEN